MKLGCRCEGWVYVFVCVYVVGGLTVPPSPVPRHFFPNSTQLNLLKTKFNQGFG